jgi:DNA-directed RNA polymerase specialized sigma24 family protein
MNFEDLLRRAKEGDAEAIKEIHLMYRPLLIKNAMEFGVFDEDLYQELCAALMQCIRMFTI